MLTLIHKLTRLSLLEEFMAPEGAPNGHRGQKVCTLGLALIACYPELVSSGLTTSRSSSVPAKPLKEARGDPPKDVLVCPDALLADDANDPELIALERALLLKKLARLPSKGCGLFQTTGLLEQESSCVTSASSKGRSLRKALFRICFGS
jgi:hypothetical protein